MVSFECHRCHDVVKKPKLDQHRAAGCRSGFDCLDCSKSFTTPAEYKGHTQCISEAEKYQKKLYKGPKNGISGSQINHSNADKNHFVKGADLDMLRESSIIGTPFNTFPQHNPTPTAPQDTKRENINHESLLHRYSATTDVATNVSETATGETETKKSEKKKRQIEEVAAGAGADDARHAQKRSKVAAAIAASETFGMRSAELPSPSHPQSDKKQKKDKKRKRKLGHVEERYLVAENGNAANGSENTMEERKNSKKEKRNRENGESRGGKKDKSEKSRDPEGELDLTSNNLVGFQDPKVNIGDKTEHEVNGESALEIAATSKSGDKKSKKKSNQNKEMELDVGGIEGLGHTPDNVRVKPKVPTPASPVQSEVRNDDIEMGNSIQNIEKSKDKKKKKKERREGAGEANGETKIVESNMFPDGKLIPAAITNIVDAGTVPRERRPKKGKEMKEKREKAEKDATDGTNDKDPSHALPNSEPPAAAIITVMDPVSEPTGEPPRKEDDAENKAVKQSRGSSIEEKKAKRKKDKREESVREKETTEKIPTFHADMQSFDTNGKLSQGNVADLVPEDRNLETKSAMPDVTKAVFGEPKKSKDKKDKKDKKTKARAARLEAEAAGKMKAETFAEGAMAGAIVDTTLKDIDIGVKLPSAVLTSTATKKIQNVEEKKKEKKAYKDTKKDKMKVGSVSTTFS